MFDLSKDLSVEIPILVYSNPIDGKKSDATNANKPTLNVFGSITTDSMPKSIMQDSFEDRGFNSSTDLHDSGEGVDNFESSLETYLGSPAFKKVHQDTGIIRNYRCLPLPPSKPNTIAPAQSLKNTAGPREPRFSLRRNSQPNVITCSNIESPTQDLFSQADLQFQVRTELEVDEVKTRTFRTGKPRTACEGMFLFED